MAYTELQTAAIRLVHVTRPTDRDLDYLQREFHLTPDDTEAILGVTDRSVILDQPRYRRLTVMWPTVTKQHLAVGEVHCLVGPDWLMVIDHGNFPAAAEIINELRTLPPERLWQDNPMMVLYEIWRRAIRSLVAVEPATQNLQRQTMMVARSSLADVLKRFVQSAATSDSATLQGWRWLAFTLSETNPAAVRVPLAMSNRLPLTARTYAAASAAVAIATLLVISKTL